MKTVTRIVFFAIALGFSALEALAQTAGCVLPPDGLVAWWRAENNGLDSSGTNEAVVIGGVIFADAEVGSGFSFSGSGDDYVQLPQDIFPYPSSGNGNAAFSFEAWFRTTSGGVILGQQNVVPFTPPEQGYVPAAYVGTNGLLYASMFWAGGAQLAGPSVVNDGKFHHVAVTYDGANEVLYLDGAAVAGIPFVQEGYAANYSYQLGTGWTDGWADTPGGWFPFTGIIDEVSLYSRSLSPAEIAAIKGAGVAGKCAPPTGPALLHRYSFNEAAGTRLVHDSIRGANGLLVYLTNNVPYTNGTPDGSGFAGDGQLRLQGTSGFVALPPGLISSLTNMTIEAWVTWNGPATSAWQRIFDFGFNDHGTNASGIGTNYVILCPSRGGTEVLGFEETTVNPFGSVQDTNSLILTGPGQMPIGQETFIALAYDPGEGACQLYVNGFPVGSVSRPLNPLSVFRDLNCWFGRSQWQRDPLFNGQYNEFRIWEGVLSESSIANHYAAGPNQPFMIPRPLLKIARLDQSVILTWSTNNSPDFRLEAAADLRSSSWLAVTNPLTVSGPNYRVAVPVATGAAYYRLKQ
jgi:hypothetical protein